jgi:ParB family chromosome partitioning protein
VSGERRLRAAKLAGLSLIPSIILDVEQEISAEMSIIENIHSEPLNYFEHAVALQRLKEHYQDDFCDVSSRLGLSEHQMSKKLKLLELSYNERQILLNMNVSENNALGIAQITDKAQRHMLIESICGEGLNEDAIKSRLEFINQSNARSNCDLELPRDVSSAIKGIISKINFLNRYKKRADVKLSRSIDCITLNIIIKL